MSPFQRATIALLGAALAVFVWLGRYALVVGSVGDRPQHAYLLDRWTGRVEYIHIDEVSAVKPAEP